jgi:3-hydroxymyristoyl/3-hydroxydecanoyl-(acyl carrier protein) dehydratase
MREQPPLRFSVAHGHPSLPGHFPGRPVVPGVVVLDEAVALVLLHRPADRLAGLDEVKFLAPVLPGDAVTVTCSEGAPGRLHLACTVAGRAVLRARVRLGGAG